MLQEFFAQYGSIFDGVTIGALFIMAMRVLSFFKKDKYVLPFINTATKKATSLFGADNVAAFMKEAKNVKVSEIKPAIQNYADRFLRVERLLEVLVENQLKYDNFATPELKEKAEKEI